jgi:hypothetical protein
MDFVFDGADRFGAGIFHPSMKKVGQEKMVCLFEPVSRPRSPYFFATVISVCNRPILYRLLSNSSI